MAEENPVVHLFYCANCMAESEVQGLQTRFGSDELKVLALPCSGKVTVPYVLKAFETGADGVAICSCVPAECRNLEGNLRASKRAQAVDALLEEIGLGAGRVLMLAKEQGQVEKAVEGIQSLQARLAQAPVLPHEKPARILKAVRPSSDKSRRQETAA